MDYGEWLRTQYGEIIDGLDLGGMQKSFLRARWLDLVVWNERHSDRASKMYYGLRITTLVGGATATAFASLKLSGAAGVWISALIFALTLTTTIAAGLEELLKFGDQRMRYGQTAGRLKREGWLFFQLTGPYHQDTHQTSFAMFSERIEEIAGGGAGPAQVLIKQPAHPQARSAG